MWMKTVNETNKKQILPTLLLRLLKALLIQLFCCQVFGFPSLRPSVSGVVNVPMSSDPVTTDNGFKLRSENWRGKKSYL